MAWLAPVLCMLLCPILMGVMMSNMKRGSKSSRTLLEGDRLEKGSLLSNSQQNVLSADRIRGILRTLWCSMCINWKVVGLFIFVGLGVAIIKPSFLVAIGPILIILICPISMLLSMRTMRRHDCSTPIDRELPNTENIHSVYKTP